MAERLVRERKPVTNDADMMVLLHDRVRLQNEHAEATQRIADARADGDVTDWRRAGLERDEIERQLQMNHLAAAKSSSEAGRRLNATKAGMANDYTLATAMTRLRVAFGDKPVPGAMRERAETLARQIAEKDAQIAKGKPTAPEAAAPTDRSSARARLTEVNREIRRLKEPGSVKEEPVAPGPRGPSPEARNRTRLKQLEKEKAELARRIRENDFAPAPKRAKPVYGEDVAKALRDRAQLRAQMDRLVAKAERTNATPLKKFTNFFHNLHLFNIFTSGPVFLKLGAAVVGGHAHAITSAATISAAKMIPAIRKIAEQSPDYGAGVAGLKD